MNCRKNKKNIGFKILKKREKEINTFPADARDEIMMREIATLAAGEKTF